MKKDGAICWVAPSSPRCWAVQSSDLAPVAVVSWPQDVPEAADAIRGTKLEDEAIAAAAQAAFKPSKPMDNTDFGLAWRKEMTRQYVKGALEELLGRR